ncbi:MAG: hypothetical protein JXR73_08310 [Candidatus Omnitrophica bacterium]|nr:hypothetical protein [Candidatus Omnitrophota bacterium]
MNGQFNRINKHLFATFFTAILIAAPLFIIKDVFCQDRVPPQKKTFHFVMWPGANSTFQYAPSGETSLHPLFAAWNNSHLLAYTGLDLSIESKSDSLDAYLRKVKYLEPECIEGDFSFVTEEINQEEKIYYPLLEEKRSQSIDQPPIQGEIIFLEQNDLWQGKLGVVHPRYSVGGKYQIEYWKKEAGEDPQTVVFYSPMETLRHLFVGSIQAAAVPVGQLEIFLEAYHRQDLLDRLIRIPAPGRANPPAIFLHKQYYANPLIRTLITETWLRDHFQNQLAPLPVTIAQE